MSYKFIKLTIFHYNSTTLQVLNSRESPKFIIHNYNTVQNKKYMLLWQVKPTTPPLLNTLLSSNLHKLSHSNLTCKQNVIQHSSLIPPIPSILQNSMHFTKSPISFLVYRIYHTKINRKLGQDFFHYNSWQTYLFVL